MFDFTTVLTVLYAIDGSTLFLLYLPQILAVYRDRDGAKTISLWTWGLWAQSSIITAAYAHFVAKDLMFTIMSIGNFAGCGSVLFLTLLRRHQHRKLTNPAPCHIIPVIEQTGETIWPTSKI
jgi:hypothetical protein